MAASIDPRQAEAASEGVGDRAAVQELFVPVHGYVRLFPEEMALIDHPAFQRLRRLRQLGFAHFVFPGACHSRFEHVVGALHVASKMIEHVNQNVAQARIKDPAEAEHLLTLDDPEARFIRMAALCHDIGHLSYSHTLEDELAHLRPHDDDARLMAVGEREWGEYRLNPELAKALGRMEDDPTFRALVDHAYGPWLKKLCGGREPMIDGRTRLTPFEVLCILVTKESDLVGKEKSESRAGVWQPRIDFLNRWMPVDAARDMVGDTICADFLDYIHRDWYHVGKPIQNDDRLYHYMQIRRRPGEGAGKPEKGAAGACKPFSFVIDVGPRARVRTDALTLILDLLEARYKLTETVLFHRTKLSVIALLDRVLLEVRELYRAAELGGNQGSEAYFQERLLRSLLGRCDDQLRDLLHDMLMGKPLDGIRDRLERVVREGIADAGRRGGDGQGDLGIAREGPKVVDFTLRRGSRAVASLSEKAQTLIHRLDGRGLYTLVDRLDATVFGGVPGEGNANVEDIIKRYADPEERYTLLRAMETACGFERGTLLMYCPPKKRMGAKIAKVNLHVDGEITPFDEYEKKAGPNGLTCNALTAQVDRFYQLWGVWIFMERQTWDALSPDLRGSVKEIIRQLVTKAPEDQANARSTSVAAIAREIRGRDGAQDASVLRAARNDGYDPVGPDEDRNNLVWTLPNGVRLYPFEP